MSAGKSEVAKDKVTIEEALIKTGFGLYTVLLTSLIGVIYLTFVCVVYGSTILVPTSACELGTTTGQQGAIAAAPVVGSIVGALVWGYLADTKGRRPMLMVALLCGSIINCLASISVNWIMLMLIQFLASTMASGLTSMGMAIMSESVPMQYRNLLVLLVMSVSYLGQGIMAVLAIPVIPLSFSNYLPALGIYWNSWRTLVLVYSMPGFLTAACVYFIKESPKFLLSKGDIDGAMDSLRSIHRCNNLFNKNDFEIKSLVKETSAANATVGQKQLLIAVFQGPLLKYTIIMITLNLLQQIVAFVIWLPTIVNKAVNVLEEGDSANFTMCELIRYDLDVVDDPDGTPCALNVTSLLILFGAGAFQAGVNVILSLIVNKTGRRNLVIVMNTTCGLAGILVNLVPNVIGSAVLFAIQLLGVVLLGMYIAIVIALYPTHLRAIALALCATSTRLGTFASAQILNIMLVNSCEAGFYLFSSLLICSAIITLFLPDDRRIRAPAPPPKEGTSSDLRKFDNESTETNKL